MNIKLQIVDDAEIRKYLESISNKKYTRFGGQYMTIPIRWIDRKALVLKTEPSISIPLPDEIGFKLSRFNLRWKNAFVVLNMENTVVVLDLDVTPRLEKEPVPEILPVKIDKLEAKVDTLPRDYRSIAALAASLPRNHQK